MAVPVVFTVGCQAADAPAPSVVERAATTVKVAPEKPPVVVEAPGPRPLGKFNVTFYYVIGEEEVVPKVAPANDNALVNEEDEEGSGSAANGSGGTADLAAMVPPRRVTLYSGKTCEPLAEVSPEFAQQLRIQGTGKLRDGRVLNVWGNCECDHSPCYKVTEQQWGTAGTGRALQPFRTVAVDPKVVKLGSLLYIPLLEGRMMPGRAPWGGFVHDGCVVADDTGGGIKDYQIDLFVGRRGWFLGLSGSAGSHAWARHVPVFDGSKVCQRQGRKVSRRSGSI